MNNRLVCATVVMALLTPGVARSQDPVPAHDGVVTRDEFEALRQELLAAKAELAELKANQGASGFTDADMDEIDMRLSNLSRQYSDLRSGTNKFHVTGYTSAGFTDPDVAGGRSSFSAGLNPILLWELGDDLFVESELEIELEGSDTNVDLEYAQIAWNANDYVTVAAGKFLTPFGLFNERLHPAWINKLPDAPLMFASPTRIVPNVETGVQVRGAVPVHDSMVNYAVYASNGATVDTGDTAADQAGHLKFKNFEDSNNNKAVGGRIGVLVSPALEIGASMQRGTASADSITDVDYSVEGLDLTWLRECEALQGSLDVRAEWARSNVDGAVYDASGTLGFGPSSFNNTRDGGYVQCAYRPTKVDSDIFKKCEFVVRYDMLDQPTEAPESFDENRWTFGLNYWKTASSVVKVAFQRDNKTKGDVPHDNRVLLSWAAGF